MENIQIAFADLVKERLKALNTNAFSVENEAGLPPDAVRNVLRGVKKDGPSISRALEICEALGLDFYIGPKRETASVPQVTLKGADYASIPLHEAWLSAGPGIDNGGANFVDHLAFRRDWLKRIGISASQSCLARVTGDSMFPTLSPGDMVLLDTSRIDPPVRSRTSLDRRRPMIWALLDDGEARIKRIERPNADTIMLVSDNPDHPPELRTGHQLEQLKVIGKVVWWGHTNSNL